MAPCCRLSSTVRHRPLLTQDVFFDADHVSPRRVAANFFTTSDKAGYHTTTREQKRLVEVKKRRLLRAAFVQESSN